MDRRDELDVWTIVAIAVVAYCVTNVIHEGLGHGGACLIAGGKPIELNAIFFRADDGAMTAWGHRVYVAGGSVANLLAAAGAWLALRACRRPGARHYFFALMLTLNVLMPFGYLLFSGASGYGDWASFVDGLGPALLMRAILAVAGVWLYCMVAPTIVAPVLNPYLGRDPARRAARARWFLRIPYVAGGVVFVIAGLLNPYGWKLVFLSAAAASFGGTSLLLWWPGEGDTSRTAAPVVPAGMRRSWPWIAAASVTAAVFIGVLGPGVAL